MVQRDNIVSFDRPEGSDDRLELTEENKAIIDSCRSYLSGKLHSLTERMFEKLDDALFQLADKAESNGLQTAYFDAMREVRKQQKSIEKSFYDQLVQGFDGFWSRGVVAPSTVQRREELDHEELSLIDPDALEETLAVTNMISKCESHSVGELYGLEKRFSKMARGAKVDKKSNPLRPAVICEAFSDSIKGLSVDTPTKLVIYKLFDREVVTHVGGFYGKTNEIMRQAGVLPKLTPARLPNLASSSESQGRTETSAVDECLGESEEVAGAEDIAAVELFSTLQQLLGQRRYFPPGERATAGGLPIIGTSQVLGTLSEMQRGDIVQDHPADNLGSAIYLDIKSDLMRQLKALNGNSFDGRVRQADGDAIDVVSMLFEFILEDPSLPDAMKVLLAQLQIPMVKVAILDKGFFSKRSHPARRLLNDMSHAVIGWSGGTDRSENSLYGKVESIVRRILSEFTDDVGLFSELGEEFSKFLAVDQRISAVAEERATQVVRGKEQLGVAKRRVSDEINRRLRGRSDVPSAVVNLLKDGWKDVLMLHFLRRGAKSDDWLQDVLWP